MASSSIVTNDDVLLQDYYLSPAESFYTSFPGLLVVTVAASLSALCSGVIIFVICKSQTKLASIYHRIMFFMSISDVIASTAVALTTLVMPKDMIYTDVFPKGWPIYGTEATCSAQGFIFLTFTFLTYACDLILCIYYLCSIRFAMSDRTFSLRLEWVLYTLFLIITLAMMIPDLVQGNFNPSPDRAWCVRRAYPYDCHGDACIRGEKIAQKKMIYSLGTTVGMAFLMILCLVLTVLHVYRKDRASVIEYNAASLSKYDGATGRLTSVAADDVASDAASFFHSDDGITKVESQTQAQVIPPKPSPSRAYYCEIVVPSTSSREAEEDGATCIRRAQHYENTKIIMKQAFAYVFVYTVIGALLCATGSGLLMTNVTFTVVHAVIRPSHGTLNMIIFLYHKYFNLRKNYELLSSCEVLGKLFRRECEEPEMIVESLTPVINDVAIRNAERLRDLNLNREERVF
jgi:hypothetical protein